MNLQISPQTKREMIIFLIVAMGFIWLALSLENNYQNQRLEELKIEKQKLEKQNEELFQEYKNEIKTKTKKDSVSAELNRPECGEEVADTVSGEIKEISLVEKEIREVSAYNLVESQCDSSPTIGAFGDDLLEMINQGINVCASNAFPENTRLHIQNYGECIVKDKMASRYKENIDLCFGMDIQRAKNFGRQKLSVKVLDD